MPVSAFGCREDDTHIAELARLLRISGVRWEEYEVVVAASKRSKRRYSFARDLWGATFFPRIMRIHYEVEYGESYSLIFVEGHQAFTVGHLQDLLPEMHRLGCRTARLDFGLSGIRKSTCFYSAVLVR